MIDASGIGVYLRECLPFFLDSGFRFLLLGDPSKLKFFAEGRENAEILDCRIKPFSFRELLFFPRLDLKKINKTALYYSPYFNIPRGIKIPVYATIHDMIFPDMPELTSPLGLAARMWFYRRAFARSRKIFTVSEFSKSRIEHYSRRKVPVIVTHSAIQPWMLKRREAEPAKKNIILFIGNIKKHKGLKILLDAFLEARGEGLEYKLVIAGGAEKLRTLDADFSSLSFPDDSVEFTGFISDDELLRLLGEASLLVQPSLYEGFCLPPLEAMVCGTRALISDIPVLREIYRDFPVHYFKAGDSRDLKEKLMLLVHEKDGAGPGSPGLRLSPELESRYTFKKTSSVILETFVQENRRGES
jgi:glycosyltransferase involved in cell wall biosynthesis